MNDGRRRPSSRDECRRRTTPLPGRLFPLDLERTIEALQLVELARVDLLGVGSSDLLAEPGRHVFDPLRGASGAGADEVETVGRPAARPPHGVQHRPLAAAVFGHPTATGIGRLVPVGQDHPVQLPSGPVNADQRFIRLGEASHLDPPVLGGPQLDLRNLGGRALAWPGHLAGGFPPHAGDQQKKQRDEHTAGDLFHGPLV